MGKPTWTGWAITQRGAIVIFDARYPVYWKRYIAQREADEHGIKDAVIRKVIISIKPRISQRTGAKP